MCPMINTIALLVLVVAAVPTFATDYTVGDTSGWTTGVDYDTWASDKTFNVGDNLLFSYGFLHTVNEVSKDDYDSCSSTNLLQSHSDQNTKISLDKAGPRFFICGTASHCTSGMKLTVNAVPSSDSTPSSDTPAPSESEPSTPSSSDTPSTTPSEAEPSTPSTSDTPSTTPTDAEPSTPSTTITNTPSQSTSKKNTPTMTGINSAGSNGANSLIAGIAFVGLVGIMG